MRSAIYLDAHVLACPPAEDGLDAFSEYITNLVSWRELRQNDWIDVYISRNAAQALAEANAYPPYPELIKTITAFSIKHIQPKDVVDLVNGFLLKSSIIEQELGVDDLLFEDFNLEPTLPYKERRASFPYHFELLSVLLSLHSTFLNDIQNQLLLTSPDINHFGNVNGHAKITTLIKTKHDVIPADTLEPLAISARFFLCSCLHSLHLGVDPCAIWSNAKSDISLRKAIELFIYQDRQPQSNNVKTLPDVSFTFGSYFLSSCKGFGFFSEPTKIRMLLRTCGETLLNINTHATHRIRTSSGGNSPQLTRGSDTAWRRDINHEYHLHYWTTSNGYELSVVVRHNDLSIPLD